ncbi:hypothetical protein JMG10_04525 [Nostoc ellipsosporum NOK]|jgi:hypothetical protein|nr:hypothetical protein [Nostoc ellipsosporum NOK]
MEKKYVPMLVLPNGSRRRRRVVNEVKNNKPVAPVIPQSQASSKPPIIPVQSEGYIHAKRFDCL